MDIVDLPSVDGAVRILDALKRAQASQRSAVIVRPLERPRVLTVQELSFFMEERNRRQEGADVPIQLVIPHRRAIYAAPQHSASQFRHSAASRISLEQMLIGQRADFAILDTTAGMSDVVTISESIAGPLRLGFKICRCTTDPSHVYVAGELIVPGKCNIDGDPVVCS
jgi:hypothetical protein